MPAPPPVRTRLVPRALLVPLLAAFGIGLLLFLLLWLDQRNDTDFFRSDGTPAADVEPLPAPLPPDLAGADDSRAGLPLPPDGRAASAPRELPRVIDDPPPPPPPIAAPSPPRAEVPFATGRSGPVPISQPPPRYPLEALRRNVGGVVRIGVTVASDGRVERLEVVESSGYRQLDRAAAEAVRRWRFRPAVHDGEPVAATVVVPVVFSPGG